ncbi:ATP-binding SpoIIE family protein phosphatase [Streptomyces xanthii]|uniref:SpoIIE family protein phosphatase n=1 Tax=Streptomyces xanthii TaxID=2768069 RepID=A0A7H1BK54_9ACTN|nr:SpoIIE family protein phosphatase [Streptomyces xanthii]QNS09109.1 SpoIIE family protein phosphatase [Streptomyces xanthii]
MVEPVPGAYEDSRYDEARSARVPADLAWLNAAGRQIGTTLDLRRTTQELVDFVVPEFADGAAVDLLESVLRGAEVDRWRGPGMPAMQAMAIAWIPQVRMIEATPVGSATSFAGYGRDALTSGEPVLVSRVTPEDFTKIASTPSGAGQLRAAGVHSYLVVPVIARGVLLGLADFVRAGDRPGFDRADVALATELLGKAAVAFDNARLYQRERDTVVTLQHSLLPRESPLTLQLEVRPGYQPARDRRVAGGDWFDIAALPGGRTALVVGDVLGGGLSAAATMGRLRGIARVLLALDTVPERVLTRLDLAARDLDEEQVATCLVAVYDPADGSCALASAGHLPPLVVDRDGDARFVDLPVGGPIGAGAIPYEGARITLPQGARLMLYTDGLTKTRGGDLAQDLERLRRTAAEMPAGAPAPGVDQLATPERFDDAVLLVADTHDAAEDIRMWELPADASAGSFARKVVRGQLADWGQPELQDSAELVVSEMVGNAMRYGRGPGPLRLVRHGRVIVELADRGPDLPQIQFAAPTDEGGRGLQLINMLCRRWGACRTAYGKSVWAELDLPTER